MKPWEKYGTDTESKPWEKYGTEDASRTTSEVIADIPQAIGKTARVGVEGLVGVPTGLVNLANTIGDNLPMGKVVNAVGNYISPQYGEMKDKFSNAIGGLGENIADAVGLPQFEGATERVIGKGAELGVGTGALVKGANYLSKTASPASQKILAFLSNAPKAQVAGAVGSGVAGQTAKENGVGPVGQTIASVAGGLGAASTMSTPGKIFNTTTTAMQPTDAAGRAMKALEDAGINTANLSDDVKNALTSEVEKALKISPNLDAKAIGRLADYKQTGLTPTSGNLTGNASQITRERNLAKVSANSSDPAAQQLSNVARDNEVKLIDNLNTLGADTDDAVTASRKIIDTLNVKDAATKKVIGKFYEQARNTEGRSALLNPRDFTQKANDALDEALLGGKLPGDVRNKINSIAKGDVPLTVDVAEQLKTNIGTLQRSSTDPAERLALGKVREALDNTALVDGQGKEAINAFNKARKANRAYMQMVERNPALQAVRDGVEPDKFVNKFIIGSGDKANISQVQALKDSLKDNPEATTAIRSQLSAYLKDKALSGSADDVGKFSQKGYNKALKDIGDEKLAMFFSPEDIGMLKAIGRTASYEQAQTAGMAVNNSNSAAAVEKVLERLANSPLVRKVPFGAKLIAEPANDINTAVQSRKALNQSKAIALPKPKETGRKSFPLSTAYGSAAVVGNGSDD